MFDISDNRITYKYFPKHTAKWREKFFRIADLVAKEKGLNVELGGRGKSELFAIYSNPKDPRGLRPVFTEEEAENIHGKYFGDFH